MSKRVMVAVAALLVSGCGGVTPEAAAPADTIAVHGDWTIDVYDPDGSLDEHIEFENGLHPQSELASLFAGDFAISGLLLRLSHPINIFASPCFSGWDFACVIQEGETAPSGTFAGLEVTEESGVLTLVGSFAAENDGTISRVESLIHRTPDATDGRTYPWLSGLTLRDVDPIAVSEGQTVQVEVVISFTTG